MFTVGMDIIRLKHSHEMLALFPYLYGFKPKDSVVLVAFKSGGGGPGGPVARIDAERIPAGLIDVALEFIDTFTVEELYIGWYGSDLEDMLNDTESVDLLDTVGLACQQCIDVRTSGSGFVNIGLTDYANWVTCEDARGASFAQLKDAGGVEPFAALETSPIIAQAVFAGVNPVDEFPRPEKPRLPWEQRRQAVEAARAWRAAKRKRGVRLWQAALDARIAGADCASAVGSEEKAGHMNAALDDILLRDRLILFGVDESTVKLAGISARKLARELGAVQEPSQARITMMIELLEFLGARSDDDDPAAFSVAAYLAWWQGDRERALGNASMAINSDRHYPLAKLVLHALFVHLPSPRDDPAYT